MVALPRVWGPKRRPNYFRRENECSSAKSPLSDRRHVFHRRPGRCRETAALVQPGRIDGNGRCRSVPPRPNAGSPSTISPQTPHVGDPARIPSCANSRITPCSTFQRPTWIVDGYGRAGTCLTMNQVPDSSSPVALLAGDFDVRRFFSLFLSVPQ